ncbi:MAG: class I SAM-dependent methyltransferase [Rhizobiaceae bacterium]
MTTPLAGRLKRQIAQTGPIPVSDYMALCLFDPQDGYYTTGQPFGRDGDFITAPEISQMFGELVAIWLLAAWHAAGSPKPAVIAEIGPGRGTLMADMLRSLEKIAPDFPASAEIGMIETSPRLAGMQRETLGDRAARIRWTETVDQLSGLPLFMVGNELFDAVPARQYVKMDGCWLERMVGIDQAGELEFVAGAGGIDPALLPAGAGDAPDGTVFETAPAREAMAAEIGGRVATHGGAALFFDYGHLEPGFGDTLQAVRGHRPVDIFSAPGQADLTTHVDFAALVTAARAAGADTAFLTQGEFLLRMGVVERAGRLGADADAGARQRIEAEVERLAGPQGMGDLFKVMAMFERGVALGPFAAAS